MGSGASSNRSTPANQQESGPNAARLRNIRSNRNERDGAGANTAPFIRALSRQPTANTTDNGSDSRMLSRPSLSERNQQRNTNLISLLRTNGRGLTHIVCHQCRSIHWTLANNPENCRLCGSAFIEVFDASAYGMAPDSGNPRPTLAPGAPGTRSDEYLLNMAYLAGMRDLHPLMGMYGQSIEERVMAESFNNQPYIAHPAPKEVIAMLIPQRYDKYKKDSKEELDQDKKECCVCKEGFEGADLISVLPKCAHIFHQDCCTSWLELQSTCPICRSALTSISVFNEDAGDDSESKDGFQEEIEEGSDSDNHDGPLHLSKTAEACVNAAFEAAIRNRVSTSNLVQMGETKDCDT